MSADVFWAALGLALIFEGLMPLIAPRRWRQTFWRIIQLKDGQLRFFGLVSVSLGAILLLWLTA